MEIRVDDKNIEKAIRLLKRKMQNDGLFRELKNRRFYEKPSLKKKRKRIEAQKRKQKSLRNSRQSRAQSIASVLLTIHHQKCGPTDSGFPVFAGND